MIKQSKIIAAAIKVNQEINDSNMTESQKQRAYDLMIALQEITKEK